MLFITRYVKHDIVIGDTTNKMLHKAVLYIFYIFLLINYFSIHQIKKNTQNDLHPIVEQIFYVSYFKNAAIISTNIQPAVYPLIPSCNFSPYAARRY